MTPHRSRLPFARAASSPVLFGAFLAACSSSGAVGPPPATSGVLHIASLEPVGAPAVTPAAGICVETGRDPDATVAVVLETDSNGQLLPRRASTAPAWTLLPPHGCDGTAYCGYVQLTVDSCDPGATGGGCTPRASTAFAAASSAISVATAKLASPLGPHRFRVELRNSDGTIEKNTAGQPFVDEAVVDLELHCGGSSPSDAGTDAALSDAAPDATPSTRDSGAPDASADAGSTDAADSGHGDSGAGRVHEDAGTRDARSAD